MPATRKQIAWYAPAQTTALIPPNAMKIMLTTVNIRSVCIRFQPIIRLTPRQAAYSLTPEAIKRVTKKNIDPAY